MSKFILITCTLILSLVSFRSAWTEEVAQINAPSIKPFRTFITIQRYTLDNNGTPDKPVSNVRLELGFPNGESMKLPEGGGFWMISNGQSQEINRSFEVPFSYVQNDGFKLKIQMIRKGTVLLPCQFDIDSLSQFNRSYVCHTDEPYQVSQNTPKEKIEKEALQIRIFTDRNSPAKDIPNQSLAIK